MIVSEKVLEQCEHWETLQYLLEVLKASKQAFMMQEKEYRQSDFHYLTYVNVSTSNVVDALDRMEGVVRRDRRHKSKL